MDAKPMVSDFCWNELATSNVQAAKEFYGDVFGWEFFDHEMGEMTYTMIRINGKDAAGIWSIPKDKEKEIPPHWMSYILVNDVEAMVEKVESHGGVVIKPAANAGDFGRFAIIRDPTGAHIALWQTFRSA